MKLNLHILALALSLILALSSLSLAEAKCIKTIDKALAPEQGTYGPILKTTLKGSRSIEQIKELKIVSFNALGLREKDFQLMPFNKKRLSEEVLAAGERAHRLQKAEILKELDADFVFIQEIGKEGRLRAFNEELLGDTYEAVVLPVNNVPYGVLVKKDLPFELELHSFKEMPLQDSDALGVRNFFSRDAQVLVVKSPEGDPLAAMIQLHLKSKISARGDPLSSKRRTAEVEALDKVMNQIKEKYPNIPFMMMGDFNGEIVEKEFKALDEMNFSDVFELSAKPELKDPVTHVFIDKENDRVLRGHLDYIIVDENIKNSNALIDTDIVRYKDPQGNLMPYPETLDEQYLNPSDHYPVWATFDFSKLQSI